MPPNGVYFPGSVVSGALVIEVDEPKSYNGIQIALVGRAVVSWSELQGEVPVTLSSNEEYVSLGAVLWSKQQAVDHKLPAGRHSFQFRFLPFPQRIPPNFMCPEGIGSVRYYVQGRVSTGLLNQDMEVQKEIAFAQALDINVLTPIDLEREGTVGRLLCTSGPITMTVHLPRTGFCIGESIPVRVTLNNRSSRPITVRAEIVQMIKYQVQGRTMIRQNILCMASTNPMPARSVTVWNPGAQLPKVPPVTISMTTPNRISTC